jgi:hypothetical protein
MFGRVKRWLNIEGVRLNIECSDYIRLDTGCIEGKLRLVSMSDHTVQQISIRLTETYTRGRGSSKRIDDYILADDVLKEPISLKAQEDTVLDFTLNFYRMKSRIEQFGDKNILAKSLAAGAALLKGAQSVYKLEAFAKINGSAVDAVDHKFLLPS